MSCRRVAVEARHWEAEGGAMAAAAEPHIAVVAGSLRRSYRDRRKLCHSAAGRELSYGIVGDCDGRCGQGQSDLALIVLGDAKCRFSFWQSYSDQFPRCVVRLPRVT